MPGPFDSSKHPRDHGRFASKGNADTAPSNPRPTPHDWKREHAATPIARPVGFHRTIPSENTVQTGD